MTEGEFISLLIESNTSQSTERLKEYIKDHRAAFFSKIFFIDHFLNLLMELKESDPELPLIQLLHTITESILGPADLINYMDDKEYMVAILKWIKAMETLDYVVIDRTNNDYEIIKTIIERKKNE